MQTPLIIHADDQGKAIALGAVLDQKSGRLFAPPGADLAVFHAWLPASKRSTAITPPKQGLSLTELLGRITNAIDAAFPRAVTIKAGFLPISKGGLR